MKILIWAAGIFAVLFFLVALSDLFIITAISILLALILHPLVLLLEKQGLNRITSVITVFLFIGFLVYLGLSFIIPKFLFQFNQLVATLREYSLHEQIMQLETEIYKMLPFFTPGDLAKKVEALISTTIVNLFDQVSELLSSIVSIIAILVIVPFITFFLLKDNKIIMRGLIHLMPNSYFEMSYWILKKVSIQLGRFVRAWIFDATFVGVLCGFGFYLIGIDYALPLGVIAGLGHLVPYFGPVIGGIPAAVISIIQYGDLSHIPFIIFLIITVYTLDNGFFQPYIFSKSVDMHPIIIILLIIAGSQLFGVIGMLLAIPVATVVKTAATEIYFAFKNYKIAKL